MERRKFEGIGWEVGPIARDREQISGVRAFRRYRVDGTEYRVSLRACVVLRNVELPDGRELLEMPDEGEARDVLEAVETFERREVWR
jgi:hypothetical protein